MGWPELIMLGVQLGVKTWQAFRPLMQDAGLDDAQIALLKPKWDTLVDDIARASKPPAA